MQEQETTKEQLERVITALVDQIEFLSKRSKMLDVNDKTTNSQKYTEWALEASTLMLQLSRSVNELLTTKNFIEQSEANKQAPNAVEMLMMGVRRQ